MWIYVVLTVLGGSLLSLVVYLSTKNGSRLAQLEAIKEELKRLEKEEKKANEISNKVAHLTADDARRRLHEVANSQQRNNMQ